MRYKEWILVIVKALAGVMLLQICGHVWNFDPALSWAIKTYQRSFYRSASTLQLCVHGDPMKAQRSLSAYMQHYNILQSKHSQEKQKFVLSFRVWDAATAGGRIAAPQVERPTWMNWFHGICSHPQASIAPFCSTNEHSNHFASITAPLFPAKMVHGTKCDTVLLHITEIKYNNVSFSDLWNMSVLKKLYTCMVPDTHGAAICIYFSIQQFHLLVAPRRRSKWLAPNLIHNWKFISSPKTHKLYRQKDPLTCLDSLQNWSPWKPIPVIHKYRRPLKTFVLNNSLFKYVSLRDA